MNTAENHAAAHFSNHMTVSAFYLLSAFFLPFEKSNHSLLFHYFHYLCVHMYFGGVVFYILVSMILLDFSSKVSGVSGSDNKDLSISRNTF